MIKVTTSIDSLLRSLTLNHGGHKKYVKNPNKLQLSTPVDYVPLCSGHQCDLKELHCFEHFIVSQ